MIDPTYFCSGCNRIRCTCPPPGYEETLWEEAYERGWEAASSGEEHPLAVYPTDEADSARARDWLRLVCGGHITDTDGRRVYGERVFRGWPRPWPHPYAYDPFRGEPYPDAVVAAFDDYAAVGVSALDDLELYEVRVAALKAYEEPLPKLSDVPLGPWPARREVAVCDEYDLPF